jgi:hypothetical protein
MKNHLVEEELFHAEKQTDEQTGITTLIVRFYNSFSDFNET